MYSKKGQRIFLGCVLFLVACDILFKSLALRSLLPHVTNSIFSIAYFANPGIAFSIPLPQSVTLIITGLLMIGFVALLIKSKRPDIKIALVCALLGAFSNFIDRLITGFTTDYFILFSRSAINIADILIIAGIGYCAWYYQKADREEF